MILLRKEPRSPLRYAGGKSRGVMKISKYIPDGTREMASPFLGGGGSVELACSNNGILVHCYDNFLPLVEFWQCILDNPRKLAEIIKGYTADTKFEIGSLRDC